MNFKLITIATTLFLIISCSSTDLHKHKPFTDLDVSKQRNELSKKQKEKASVLSLHVTSIIK